jgi:PPE-repeat protein
MDFGIYPPEINSGRLYTGPGSGPMLAAAQAWEALADELYTAAGSYQSVVSGLTARAWSGPSSASMAAAATSYAIWLSATAAQAGETAVQAKAAVAAYEAAFASTVPPPAIAANRSLLMALVATNFLGQNTPAIAAAEAQYAEMWAQDATAMYGYAGSSASATALTPFSSPHHNTDPGGSVGQAAAVRQAAGAPAGNVQNTVSGVSRAVSAAAAPAQSSSPTTLSNLIAIFLNAPANVSTFDGVIPADVLSGPVDFPIAYLGTAAGLDTDDIVSGWSGVAPWPGAAQAPPTEFSAMIANPGPLAASAPAISAGLGRANTIGALSVPPHWTLEALAVRPAVPASPAAGITPAVAALEAGSGSAFGQLGLAGILGSAMAGAVGAGDDKDRGTSPAGDRVAARPAGSAATDSKSPASHDKPRIVVTGVAARIRQLATLRDQGRLSDEEFTEHKNRLLER